MATSLVELMTKLVNEVSAVGKRELKRVMEKNLKLDVTVLTIASREYLFKDAEEEEEDGVQIQLFVASGQKK